MDKPYWIASTPDVACPPLTQSLETDVVIIGGGLTGLNTALKLLEEDRERKVVLLEADLLCSDASGRTMGKVTISHDRVYSYFSPESGKHYVSACMEGFNRILHLIDRYGIDCNLEPASNYIFASTHEHIDKERADFESMKRCGLEVEWVEPRDAASRELPLEFLAGTRERKQVLYHPRKFGLGLFSEIQALGGSVYEQTVATALTEHHEGVTVTIDDNLTVEAKKAVVATRIGMPVDEPFAKHISPWRHHVCAFHFEDEPIKNAYIRPEPVIRSIRADKGYLLLGGADDKALPFEDDRHYQAIETSAEQLFVATEGEAAKSATTCWWGEDVDSTDRLPLIGRYREEAKHTFMATGFCGWGMVKTAFAGIMLADLIAGRPSAYQKCFDPWRFS